jgi:hypothetical protein
VGGDRSGGGGGGVVEGVFGVREPRMNADGHGWIWGMKMGEPLRREGREGFLDWGLGIGDWGGLRLGQSGHVGGWGFGI